MKNKNLNWQVKVLDEANRIIQMTGSTEDFDRVGDRMLMSGVMLDNYLKNPVILANHNYGDSEKPTCIARSLDTRVQGKQLAFKIQFAETDNAKDWFYLYANKYMNASSIGFNPIKYEPNDQGGYDYTMWELLELSLVAVPCNPNAIQNAYRGGHISKSMYEFITQKGTIPFKHFPLADEDTTWDGPAQIKNADTNTLKLICTWYDSDNADVKGSYKLPHHLADGNHNTVWKGVAAAMAALLGAQGGANIPDADKEAVYNHLSKHYKEFGKEPPDFHKSQKPKEVENMTDEEVKSLIQDQFKDVNKEIEGLKGLKTENEKTIEDLKNEIKSLRETKGGAAISASNHEKLKGIHENMKSCQKSMSDCVKAMKDFIEGVKPSDKPDDGNPDDPEDKGLEPTEAEQTMIQELAAKKVKELLGGIDNE